MSGFDSSWLALREPADHEARQSALISELAPPPEDRPRRIIDLGTGTGSNLRYLLPRLGGRQDWLLIDNDARLLEALPDRMQSWASEQALCVQRQESDPGDGIGSGRENTRQSGFTVEGAGVSATVAMRSMDLSGKLDALALRSGDLVTCSALLDLFSPERLAALADALSAARACALFALSYDGRIDWSPALDFDTSATALLNAHQRRDKGLGGAAGPDAGAAMAAALQERGFRVTTRRADWRLHAGHMPLQRALIDGWAEAMCEQAPQRRADIQDWHRTRATRIDAGDDRLRVGHLDLVAVPG